MCYFKTKELLDPHRQMSLNYPYNLVLKNIIASFITDEDCFNRLTDICDNSCMKFSGLVQLLKSK